MNKFGFLYVLLDSFFSPGFISKLQFDIFKWFAFLEHIIRQLAATKGRNKNMLLSIISVFVKIN